jgi:hypothetical protein
MANYIFSRMFFGAIASVSGYETVQLILTLKKLEDLVRLALAAPDEIRRSSRDVGVFRRNFIQDLLEEYPVKSIVYSPSKEEIQSWAYPKKKL